MKHFNESFTSRQNMICEDYEYFHCIDDSSIDVAYHNHKFYELYILISGKVYYIIEGKTYHLKSGDIVLINNNKLHKTIIDSSEKYERIVLWIRPEFLRKNSDNEFHLDACFDLGNSKEIYFIRPSIEEKNILNDIIKKLELVFISSSYGSQILEKIYLLEFMVYINKIYNKNFEEEKNYEVINNDKIDKIIEYINNNLSNKLSLDEIASNFYISKYHMIREFKKYTGYTIYNYILQKKLMKAKIFLEKGYHVGNTASLCGFEDYSNFIRTFKKFFGNSPKKFVKSSTNNNKQ